MITLVIVKISLINVSTRLCFLDKVSMIPIRSLLGIFVCVLEISNDANFNCGTKGIYDKSFIS